MLRRRVLRIAAIAGLVLVVAGLALLAWAWGREVEVHIPEARIQEALDDHFPLERIYLGIATVRYSDPHVHLSEGSERIQASITADVGVPLIAKKPHGTAEVSGLIEYLPADGTFVVHAAQVDHIAIGGLPERSLNRLDDLISKELVTLLDRRPIYRLKPGDVKQAVARLVLKRVRVHDRELVVTLGIGP